MRDLPECAVSRRIDPSVWSALKNSIYPGAQDDSVSMVWDYCSARGLDPLLKPVHLVPMYVEEKATGKKAMRDVVMPGIGLYRIQADRSGNYAGASAPVFGNDISENLDGTTVTYPEWCEITVSKLVGDRIVSFTAREYWKENYATAGRDTVKPNSMWLKRPRGQIVKCTTAQALRAGRPELGAQPTAEEMEGKELVVERDITPARPAAQKITEADAQAIRASLNFADITEQRFCEVSRIASIEDMELSRMAGAMNWIKSQTAKPAEVIEHE